MIVKDVYSNKLIEFSTKDLIDAKTFSHDHGQLEGLEYKLDMLTEVVAKFMDVILTDEQRLAVISLYQYKLESGQ